MHGGPAHDGTPVGPPLSHSRRARARASRGHWSPAASLLARADQFKAGHGALRPPPCPPIPSAGHMRLRGNGAVGATKAEASPPSSSRVASSSGVEGTLERDWAQHVFLAQMGMLPASGEGMCLETRGRARGKRNRPRTTSRAHGWVQPQATPRPWFCLFFFFPRPKWGPELQKSSPGEQRLEVGLSGRPSQALVRVYPWTGSLGRAWGDLSRARNTQSPGSCSAQLLPADGPERDQTELLRGS